MQKMINANEYYLHCDNDKDFFDPDKITDNVKTVESILKISSTYEKFKNISDDSLKKAADLFIYLNICPDGDTKFLIDVLLNFKIKVKM